MRQRAQKLGTRNIIGERVTQVRKNQGMKQKELLARLQVKGIDLNESALSKIEGQIRMVTDIELATIAGVLNVSVDWLLGRDEPCV